MQSRSSREERSRRYDEDERPRRARDEDERPRRARDDGARRTPEEPADARQDTGAEVATGDDES
jgi:hypothetical protein